jgi:hypothetical protein
VAVFKVTSECFVEAPTLEQAISAQVDQLTLQKEGEGFYDPRWCAWFGSGSHKGEPCDEEGNVIDNETAENAQ